MIKNIKINNRFSMDNIIRMHGSDFSYKHWYLISIYGDDGEYCTDVNLKFLKNIGLQGYLSLKFYDVTEEDYKNLHKRYPQIILFNDGMAKQVIKFLDKVQKDEADSNLLVHCSAGISRSGAVGTFACDYCGLEYNKFIKENKFIMANQFVLSMLRKNAGMFNFDEEHDGIDKVDAGSILI